MDQGDEERLVVEEATPDKRPGASARKWTAVVQGVAALFMIGFGIPLVVLRFDEGLLPRLYMEGRGYWQVNDFLKANVMGSIGCGIWAPVIFLITSIVGYCSGRSRSVVSLYMALCLFSVCVSIAAGSVITGGILATVDLKGNDVWACDPYYYYEFTENMCEGGGQVVVNRPHNSYGFRLYEWDCDQYFKCKEEVARKVKIHLPLYAFSLVCVVVEFLCGILGAIFTCAGLCKWTECCQIETRQQPQQQVVYCGMNERGELTNLPRNLPRNVAYPPLLSMPGVSSPGVSYQPVSTA